MRAMHHTAGSDHQKVSLKPGVNLGVAPLVEAGAGLFTYTPAGIIREAGICCHP